MKADVIRQSRASLFRSEFDQSVLADRIENVHRKIGQFPQVRAGKLGVDLTLARPLSENVGIAFNGIQKTGPFEVSGAVARKWLIPFQAGCS